MNYAHDITYQVKFKKLFPEVEIPKYANNGDVGFDLIAHSFGDMYSTMVNGQANPTNMKRATSITLAPHNRVLVNVGYAIELPKGLQIEIRGRSGNALKKGLVLAHGVGTIDNSYRGELGFLALNCSDYPIEVSLGDKIGQAVLMPYYIASFLEVEELSKTERGVAGFGSTDLASNKENLKINSKRLS